MRKWTAVYPSLVTCVCTLLTAAVLSTPVAAATLAVPAGGNLQAAINAAAPGDTILLDPGATYTGNFVLPVTAGGAFITIRSAAADSLLPAPGQRMSPAYSPYLPRIQSPNASPAIRTAAGASYWRLQFLELAPTSKGMYDILALGDGSATQNTIEKVPHHLIVDRVYIHGHPLYGQKRAISLNSAYTTIINSYISDIKAAGQDSQAIAGWNGPGPHTIENNYLEAAGNVVLIGGDDPKVPNLVATDLVFRKNTMTRPVSWRDPIVPMPEAVRAVSGDGGMLPAGTYAYRVAARRDLGSSGTGTSAAAAEASATVADGGSVSLTWNAVADVKDYVVYGRTPAGQTIYWVTTNTAFVDTGAAGTAGTPSSKGTVWSVKNIFELKNARHVQVDHNVMENNWAQSQTGVAVLFTPRNQYGGCTWCVVEDVTFEYNVVRHTGGGITVTGWDNEHPSQQTNAIRIRHNEFSDYSKFWGGSGYFALLDNQPRDVTFDHNTLISGQGAGMMVLSGPAMSGIVITNNIAKHDSYGIFGTGKGYGNGAINYFFVNGVVTRNVLAGGRSADYPAGNLFPSVTSFQGHFTDYLGGDFALTPGTDWANAGTDSLDLGADMAGIRGTGGTEAVSNPSILTSTLPEGEEGVAYVAALEADGGRTPYQWTMYGGALPNGLQLDPLTGALSGVPLSSGDFAFTVQASDAGGQTARQPFTLHVKAAALPVSITTTALASGTEQALYSSVLNATGGGGTYVWSLAGGALPTGLTLLPSGVLSGTPTIADTYSISFRAADAVDASRSDIRTLTLTVAGRPNTAPIVTLATPPTNAPLASTVTLTATASDSDGSVARVDFYVDGVWAAVDTAAPYTFDWRATAGQHRFYAVAVDNRDASTQSGDMSISTLMEIVLHARDVKKIVGKYQLAAGATSADGFALSNPNAGAKEVAVPAAQPASYAEFQFFAEAGRAYHLWIRGRADDNAAGNDSMFVQLSNVPAALIGSTKALSWELSDGTKTGINAWGWQDDGIAAKPGTFGMTIVFSTSGLQTLRLQPREDGLRIDQIVLSPDKYLLVAPGPFKADATILPQ